MSKKQPATAMVYSAILNAPQGPHKATVELLVALADETGDARFRHGAGSVDAIAPPGRPPVDDGVEVTKILDALGRGVPLDVALGKYDKVTKDRLRPKVQKKARNVF